MNNIYDLILWYLLAVALVPLIVVGCINAILGQVGLVGYEGDKEVIDLGIVKYKIDLNGKSYFCILVLVVLGFIV